jgi:ribosomal protein S18 acetylase RimI-like enzyme
MEPQYASRARAPSAAPPRRAAAAAASGPPPRRRAARPRAAAAAELDGAAAYYERCAVDAGAGADAYAGFGARVAFAPWAALTLAPLAPVDVEFASVVLTRAFAGSAQGIPLGDGRQYCLDMLRAPPEGVLLVARLEPLEEGGGGGEGAADAGDADAEASDGASPSTRAAWLPPGQATRLVATASLSLAPASREAFPTLSPPDSAAYVCNVATDPAFRRRGLARAALAAAERLAAAAGHEDVFLHVRLADAPARALYASAGYAAVAEDNALARLRGITPRALLAKRLPR